MDAVGTSAVSKTYIIVYIVFYISSDHYLTSRFYSHMWEPVTYKTIYITCIAAIAGTGPFIYQRYNS